MLLTHCHLDHVAALPLMVDAVGGTLAQPLRVHALPATLAALRSHIFNDVIWPDFSRIPHPGRPFITFHGIEVGQALDIAGRRVEVLPAVHTVPAVGFAISAGGPCWVFSGDTGQNPAFWRRLNQLDVAALVIETAFSNREQDLARLSLHLSPAMLARELQALAPGRSFPIYITHTKPAETALIVAEVQGCAGGDIRWLSGGQELEF